MKKMTILLALLVFIGCSGNQSVNTNTVVTKSTPTSTPTTIATTTPSPTTVSNGNQFVDSKIFNSNVNTAPSPVPKVGTPPPTKPNVKAPPGYLLIDGVLITDEENLEMMRKVSAEKERRKLSDYDALGLSEKMWKEFLDKKRKEQTRK